MYDLVVIGGGSGGLTIGKYGAKLGAKVAIIEVDRLGGDCTWSGCVPSKALIASARAAHAMRRSAELGLPSATFDAPIDLGQIVDRIARLQEQIYRENDDPELLRAAGCDVIEGYARFIGPHTVEVDDHGKTRRIESQHFCIATGSSPTLPPIEGLDTVDYWTNRNVFQQRTLPQRLLVVGGGPIGLELGQAFARLGSHVSVVEAMPRILVNAEPDASELLLDCLRSEGLDIRTETLVQSVHQTNSEPTSDQGTMIEVQLRSGGETESLSFDALLLATGQRPNVGELNLELAGVDYNERGIIVDDTLRTTNRSIFAVGDVAGRHAFTHTAAYEAGIVLRNALFPLQQKADEQAVPSATFTDPEVAQVGLTEAQARARWNDVKTYRQDFSTNDRALLDGSSRGFLQFVTHGRKGRIVGAQIIGPAAGELIHEFVIAMRANLTASDIAESMHVYPTLSEIAAHAALQPYEEWLGSRNVQRVRRGYRAGRGLIDRIKL